MLVFAFEASDDPMKKFEKGSIDVTSDQDRYKKIVKYFRDDYRPLIPNLEEHGLPPDYETSVPFIVGTDTTTPDHSQKVCLRSNVMAHYFHAHLERIRVFVLEPSGSNDLVLI